LTDTEWFFSKKKLELKDSGNSKPIQGSLLIKSASNELIAFSIQLPKLIKKISAQNIYK
jgi:hypothetical protein